MRPMHGRIPLTHLFGELAKSRIVFQRSKFGVARGIETFIKRHALLQQCERFYTITKLKVTVRQNIERSTAVGKA